MAAGMQQRTVSSCTPTATGKSIANRWMWHHRVPQGAFERLELLEGKLSRAVLRGLGGSNPARLPGGVRVTGSSTSFSVRPLTLFAGVSGSQQNHPARVCELLSVLAQLSSTDGV